MTDQLRQAAQQALEQQQAEPVALHEAVISAWSLREVYFDEDGEPSMHRSPPQRPWVGLTEFQFAEIYNKWNDSNGSTPWGLNQALEAKLKELNK